MILQCDQCSTKFRLDDSRLKPGGVKVRCSKCRHVFLAGVEKHEESEFDAILSGLGAPAPEKGTDAAHRDVGMDTDTDLAGFALEKDAGVHPAVSAGPAEASPFAESPVSAAPKPGQAAAPGALSEPEAAAPKTPAAAAQFDVADFAAFDFPAEAVEPPELPASRPEPVSGFSDFDLAATSAALSKPGEASSAAGLDYGEFSFDEEPAPLQEEPVAPQEQALDFGEFSFPSEPEPTHAKAEPPALDFGEFEFDAEPAVKAEEPAAASDELDFGDFAFAPDSGVRDEASVPPATAGKAPAAGEEAFDFGAFSFSEEPALLKEEQPAAAAAPELDFGEFSFTEEPALLKEAEPAAADQDFEFGEFSFAETPVAPSEAATAAQEPSSGGDFSFSAALPHAATPDVPDAGSDFSFEGLSLSQEQAGKLPAAAPVEPAPAVAAATADTGGAPVPGHPEIPAQLPPDGEAAFDFGLAATPAPTRAHEPFELSALGELGEDDGLPPLSIASRRKGRSLLTISIIVISVLVIIALSGAGFYLLQSGPAAFDKLGLGFVAKWFGMESVEEGRITINNPQAAFYQNKEVGELFVVTGEAQNSFRKARASILVKVSLFDKKGAVLLQKTAYCGNRLSAEQLATLPMAKIESIMNNQFGDSLANLGVQPGSSIGFTVAIPNVPKEAADFGVEVVGSTVAGK